MTKKSNNNNDLSGFRDFIESEGLNNLTPKKSLNAKNSSFELYTFLERESIRLDKLLSLYLNKSYMLKKHPQNEKILKKQEDDRLEITNEVIVKLARPDSPVSISISEVLLNHFTS